MPDMSRYLRSCRPIRERLPDFVSDRVIFGSFEDDSKVVSCNIFRMIGSVSNLNTAGQ